MRRIQKVSYKFNEDLIATDGIDKNEFEKTIKETFAKYGLTKRTKAGNYIAPDREKDYYFNFGKALLDLGEYKWVTTYLSELYWYVDGVKEDVLKSMRQIEKYGIEQAVRMGV